MAALTHTLTHRASGHTEKVSDATLKLLTEQKRLKLYDVAEIKAVDKPSESIGRTKPEAKPE